MLKFLKMAPPKPTQPNPTQPKSGQQRPTQRSKPSQTPPYRSHPPRPPAGPPEVIDPMWLLKAAVIVILAALICGYGSLCLLLYQGQWQLILHPTQSAAVPATIAGTSVQLLRFGTDESATPQLTGWSIPAAPGARYAGTTILFLPPGNGSLVDATPTLALLHDLGVTLFAIDYRGYGQSAAIHPNQVRMTQDADTAFRYLTTSRAVPEHQIVPFGSGVAASLATHLAAEHPGIPAVILDAPGPDPLNFVLNDPRTHFLPVRALLHDRFPLAGPLATLKTPKLLLQPEKSNPAFQGAADPRITVYAMPATSSPDYIPTMTRALTRFLDQYVPSGAIQQMPSPAGTQGTAQ